MNETFDLSLRSHAAVSYGEVDLIHFLVEQGANLELRDHDGDTPILVSEDPQIYELLIQLGANPDVRNHNNEGIIEKILEDNNIKMMQYFVDQGKLDANVVLEKFNLTEEDMMEAVDEGDEEEEEDEDQEGMEDATN